MINVDEIGERIAQSVILFFNSEKNLDIIKRLRSFNLQLALTEEQLAGQTEKLLGKTFVVSGVFHTISRNELKKLIEDNGGKVSTSISTKTNYIVAGDNMGPSKLTKAQDLGITIVSEDDFLSMIN